MAHRNAIETRVLYKKREATNWLKAERNSMCGREAETIQKLTMTVCLYYHEAEEEKS